MNNTSYWGGAIALVLIFTAASLQAMQPLEVVYPEDDGPVIESQQLYIDNQAYLREFESQRRARVLAGTTSAPVAVIKKSSRTRSFTPFSFPYYRDSLSSDFLGIEVQGGATVIRYVDGYQPNCCAPLYYLRPRPPIAVPYQGPTSQGR